MIKPVIIRIDGRKFDDNYQADTVQKVKRRISLKSLNNAIINKKLSSSEIHQMKNDQSDYANDGLELSPDEQAERVNLLLIGLASLILMNAMAVLIILLVKLSKYEEQLVMNSNLIERQTKGMRTPIYFHFLIVFIFLLLSPKLITILVKNRKTEKQESTKYQRPDHYTCQVSVYLPSISIMKLILSILIFKY